LLVGFSAGLLEKVRKFLERNSSSDRRSRLDFMDDLDPDPGMFFTDAC